MTNEQLTYSPELLAPAGNEECLLSALDFGADAVYLGGTEFGMRAAPQNFTIGELADTVSKIHTRGKKVYLTCNTIPKNKEMGRMPEFLEKAADSGIDALIITDLGVLSLSKKYAPKVDIHISTQAGVVNYEAARLFYNMGAKRIVTARELSIDEIAEIRAKTPCELELESFVHGAMCVSFSGRCLLSNYLVGRDANRGDCAQPCRWKYSLMEETRPGEYFPIFEGNTGTYIMNSKDMCMIEHIPELVKAGVSSLKIEGRAKSYYYTAVITNAYRCAIDGWFNNPVDHYKPSQWIINEIRKISYRDYCTGFYFGHPNENAEIFYEGGYRREWDVVAIAENYNGEYLTAVQRNRFFEGDSLEVLEPGMEPFLVRVEGLQDKDGNPLEAASHAMMMIRWKCKTNIKKGAILRKEKAKK